ncbi:hypothetical protein [Desulfoplanes formicivorans]|uniref:Membrane protein n=1 Tax=Desulfoplanes formicivorans TaxID=1592317 RepID=A0A194AJY1_9BACT|nr:hypothetical protein [Desulfoplanes formicivorans]GAU09550.1 membrane protein [Desulfoplanes formicivorans]
MSDPLTFVQHVLPPLVRLLCFISLGILMGIFIENLRWSTFMARLATPLVRLAHLQPVAGASFAMAFFSGITANSMLAEGFAQKKITRKEVIISNLFNSLPIYFLHLPTMTMIAAPLLKQAAPAYIGLTLGAACLRTCVMVICCRLFLPPLPEGCVTCELPHSEPLNLRKVVLTTLSRFAKRMQRIAIITVPIYILVFFASDLGVFTWLETTIATHARILSWVPTQALGVIVLQISGEFSAGAAAAGALLENGLISVKAIVLALVVGNILSSPMRAFRHQLPVYAGIFKPGLALQLIAANQGLRIGSLIAVGSLYAMWG